MINNIVFDNQLYLTNHLYCLIFDIKELYPKIKKSIKKTEVVNIYDNYIKQKYI